VGEHVSSFCYSYLPKTHRSSLNCELKTQWFPEEVAYYAKQRYA